MFLLISWLSAWRCNKSIGETWQFLMKDDLIWNNPSEPFGNISSRYFLNGGALELTRWCRLMLMMHDLIRRWCVMVVRILSTPNQNHVKMVKWRFTDANGVDLESLPARFRTVTVQSSAVQNDGLLITYFDRVRLTTVTVGISRILSSSENKSHSQALCFLPSENISSGCPSYVSASMVSNCVHLNSKFMFL